MSQSNGAKLVAKLVLLTAVMQLVASASLPEFELDESDPNYWKERKEWFYKRTRFDLTEDNLKLLGPKRLMQVENKLARPKGHLPFWFDYKLYKKVFNKQSSLLKTKSSLEEEVARHNVYINTCLRVLKARVLFRMLAGTSDTFITEDADKFDDEIFGPMGQHSSGDNNDISFSVTSQIEVPPFEREDPLDRAIRLVRQEMEIVESRNQVETNLKAFNEVDGSAIKGRLPYAA